MYEKSIVRTFMYLFFVMSALSIIHHIYVAVVNGQGMITHRAYAVSRVALVGIATIALLFAWRIRTTTFQRTIIIGSLVYDSSGLLSIVSFTQHTSVFNLSGVEPYLVGCLLNYCASRTHIKTVSVIFKRCGQNFIMEVINDGKIIPNPSIKEKCLGDVLAGNGFKNLQKHNDELGGKIKVELTDTRTKITLQFLINQHNTV